MGHSGNNLDKGVFLYRLVVELLSSVSRLKTRAMCSPRTCPGNLCA